MMISRSTFNFNSVCLALVGLHLFFVGAFPPSKPVLSLEEDKTINEKIEFLKLGQKGCSQAVFLHGQRELNCTISIWYTGTFPMWLLRDDVVRDLEKATMQELRSLPIHLCTCKKVQISDSCPAEAHEITNILLHSCNESDQISSGIPVGGAVADLIKMVDDVKKLENISMVLEAPKKNNLKDVEIDDHWKSINSSNDKIASLGIKDDGVDITKTESNAKDEDDLKKGITEEESKSIDSEDEENTDDDATEQKHEDGESIGDDDTNNEDMKNDDSKLNVDKNGEVKRSVAEIKTTLTKHEVKVKKVKDDSSMKVTDGNRKEDKKYERNEDSHIDDKLTKDDLTKVKVSENHTKSENEESSEENCTCKDDQETENKDKTDREVNRAKKEDHEGDEILNKEKTDREINRAKKEDHEGDEIINKEKTYNFSETVDEADPVTMAEDENIETEIFEEDSKDDDEMYY